MINLKKKQCHMRLPPFIENIWVFPTIGVPQNGWFVIEKPIKMDDWGVPYFWKQEKLPPSPASPAGLSAKVTRPPPESLGETRGRCWGQMLKVKR